MVVALTENIFIRKIAQKFFELNSLSSRCAAIVRLPYMLIPNKANVPKNITTDNVYELIPTSSTPSMRAIYGIVATGIRTWKNWFIISNM